MLTSIALMTVLAQDNTKPLVCPIMADHAVPKDAKPVEYAGMRVQFCCAGCEPKFAADPKKVMASVAEKGQVGATFLFNPVTGERVNERRVKFTHDYKGVRYLFINEADLNTFKANPAQYTKAPEKEALYCPVMDAPVESYSAASNFVDHKGVRYYMCCAGCTAPFKENPDKFVGVAASHVKAPKMIQAPKVEN